MNPEMERVAVLLRQRRYDRAEEMVRDILIALPQNATAHAYLALCLNQRGLSLEALASAREAIRLAPEDGYPHFIHAEVLESMFLLKSSERAVSTAIELDPTQAMYYGHLSRLHLKFQHWKRALQAADQGLKVDAAHPDCHILRVQSLIKLGRLLEARETMAHILIREPENTEVHVIAGQTCLAMGNRQAASHHFGEAMRLNPNMDEARKGMLETAKAANPVYRLVLKYWLWQSRRNILIQFVVMIAAWTGVWLGLEALMSHAHLGIILGPVMVAYTTFVFLTWTADGLYNLPQRFCTRGRQLLSNDEVTASNWLAFFLILAGAGVCGGWASDNKLLAGIGVVAGAMLIPVAGIYRCPRNARLILWAFTGFLAAIGLLGMTLSNGLLAWSCLILCLGIFSWTAVR